MFGECHSILKSPDLELRFIAFPVLGSGPNAEYDFFLRSSSSVTGLCVDIFTISCPRAPWSLLGVTCSFDHRSKHQLGAKFTARLWKSSSTLWSDRNNTQTTSAEVLRKPGLGFYKKIFPFQRALGNRVKNEGGGRGVVSQYFADRGGGATFTNSNTFKDLCKNISRSDTNCLSDFPSISAQIQSKSYRNGCGKCALIVYNIELKLQIWACC